MICGGVFLPTLSRRDRVLGTIFHRSFYSMVWARFGTPLRLSKRPLLIAYAGDISAYGYVMLR